MRKAIAMLAGTALAAGLLTAAPTGLARQGADDPPSHDANDDRGGERPGGSGGGSDESTGGGGNRDDVRVVRRCSAASSAKLKLSPEDGGVEVEFEVDENRIGKRWIVTLSRNGERVLRRAAVTRAPSGSFEVRSVVSPGSPRTNVIATARRPATGELCRVAASI